MIDVQNKVVHSVHKSIVRKHIKPLVYAIRFAGSESEVMLSTTFIITWFTIDIVK